MGRQDGVEDAVRALGVLAGERSTGTRSSSGTARCLAGAGRSRVSSGSPGGVTFTGYVADRARVVEMIASCDICLSPEPRNPLNESSTLIKVAESMAGSRPVVAFDLKETRATAGEAAAYADGGHPEAFADAIARLLDEPRGARAQGSRSGVNGCSRTLVAALGAALLDAYGRALRPRPPTAPAAETSLVDVSRSSSRRTG